MLSTCGIYSNSNTIAVAVVVAHIKAGRGMSKGTSYSRPGTKDPASKVKSADSKSRIEP